MSKVLTVGTEVQVAVLTQVLLGEIATGFWKNARPADHADYWKGVQIVVGTELGATGFDMPRNYNFVNPDFFVKAEDRLMAAALTANPDITVKQLKKQLISINQILGARLKEVGGTVSKLPRGRKQPSLSTESAILSDKKTSKPSVRKVAAVFAEEVVDA
jgi:hypothetical protein